MTIKKKIFFLLYFVLLLRKMNEIPNIHPITSKWLREFDEIGMGYEIMLLRCLLMRWFAYGIRINWALRLLLLLILLFFPIFFYFWSKGKKNLNRLFGFCLSETKRVNSGYGLNVINVLGMNSVGFVVNSDFDVYCYSLFVVDFQLNRYVYGHQDRYFCDID